MSSYDEDIKRNGGDLISRKALREDLRRFFPVEVLEGMESKILFAQIMHDIDNATTVSVNSCRECPFVVDEEKQITNGDAWKSYCEGQEVGFKKAEDVFERMKLIQETVNCIRNTFNLDTDSNKVVRNCMALVQNAIDGEYHDMEEVDISKLERPQGEWGVDSLGHTCSNCGWTLVTDAIYLDEMHFCPNCGAKMQNTEDS